MVQKDQGMSVHQPGVRVHQRAGILGLLRLAADHPGIIRRRGESRHRKTRSLVTSYLIEDTIAVSSSFVAKLNGVRSCHTRFCIP